MPHALSDRTGQIELCVVPLLGPSRRQPPYHCLARAAQSELFRDLDGESDKSPAMPPDPCGHDASD